MSVLKADRWPKCLTLTVECTVDHIHLLLTGQLDEVHCVTGDTNGELWVQFRVVHCIFQGLAVEHVHVDVVTHVVHVTVEQVGQVVDPFRFVLTSAPGMMEKV